MARRGGRAVGSQMPADTPQERLSWFDAGPAACYTGFVNVKVKVDRRRIGEFCRRHHIRRLSLFGSVLRDDFRPDSDIDVLVDFEPGQVIGLRIIDIEDELSEILGGHKVDLVSEKYLNRHIRDRVLASAEVQYAEG